MHFFDEFEKKGWDMDYIIMQNGGLPAWQIINEGGGGLTTPTSKGSHSVVIVGGEHPAGMAVTTGHEIFGHGRSLTFPDLDQNIEAIRLENLIRRNMNIKEINRGNDHGNPPHPECLPSFR